MIAVEVLQQQNSFPNVRRILAPHKAPGILELCFLRNVRRMQLLVVHSLEFLKHNHDSRHKMMQYSCTLDYLDRCVIPDLVVEPQVASVKLITTRSRNKSAPRTYVFLRRETSLMSLSIVRFADAIVKDP